MTHSPRGAHAAGAIYRLGSGPRALRASAQLLVVVAWLVAAAPAEAVQIWTAAEAHPTPDTTLVLDNHGRAVLYRQSPGMAPPGAVVRTFRLWPEPDVVGAADPVELDTAVWPTFSLSPDGAQSLRLEPERGRMTWMDVRSRRTRSWPIASGGALGVAISPRWRCALVWTADASPTLVLFDERAAHEWPDLWATEDVPGDPEAQLSLLDEDRHVALSDDGAVAYVDHDLWIVRHDARTGRPLGVALRHTPRGDATRIVEELALSGAGVLTSRACAEGVGGELPDACETLTLDRQGTVSRALGPRPVPRHDAGPLDVAALGFDPEARWLGGAGALGWALELATGRVVGVGDATMPPARVAPSEAGLVFLGSADGPGLYSHEPATTDCLWNLEAGRVAGGCEAVQERLTRLGVRVSLFAVAGGRVLAQGDETVLAQRPELTDATPVVLPAEPNCGAWALAADPRGSTWVAVHGDVPGTSAQELGKPWADLHLLDWRLPGTAPVVRRVPWPKSIAFAADGPLLAGWSGLFRLEGGKAVRVTPKRLGAVAHVAADGERWAALTPGGTLLVGARAELRWRKERLDLTGSGLAVSAKANLVAVAAGGGVRLFRASTGEPIAELSLQVSRPADESAPPAVSVTVTRPSGPAVEGWPAQLFAAPPAP